ncbi:MAG: RluA family pseudouridine synthase [Bacilli bacterium]|nr:RluA family pseudouridine synthase [Bacilli bacterium]
MQKIKVSSEYISLRLDKFLSLVLSDVSRSKIQQYIDDGFVLVNNKKEKSSYKLEENDEVLVNDFPKEISELKAEDIPLEIVYEDDDILVINKPRGLITHPGAGNKEHTLANALKFYSDNLSSVNGDFRPGIVHRLDKDTAGLLVVAKNDFAHVFLQDQLKDHTLGRRYYALVLGTFSEEEGKIIAPIGRDKSNRLKMAVDLTHGKDAVTNFKVVGRFNGYTLLECILETGRTHQIRVHLDYIKHPVVGDPLYGRGNRSLYKDGQLLFAHHISFIHPKSKKKMEFDVPLPEYFEKVLTSLR